MLCLGKAGARRQLALEWEVRRQEAAGRGDPPKVQLAIFKPKFQFPKLSSYEGKFEEEYWSKWKKVSLKEALPNKSWVDPDKLRDLARRAGFKDQDMVDQVCGRLEQGARVGAEGRARLPTRHPNSSTIYEFGDRVSDSLQEAIVDGTMAGPLTEEELSSRWPDFSVNPLGGRLKVNGKLRIIVDASSPHDKNETAPPWFFNPELPGSMNSTIDIACFPATMSSVNRLVRALFRAGRSAMVTKLDWTAAYKHQHVVEEDLKLQVLEWGGRFFVELCLIFGAVSSPGIYDQLAKLFLWCVMLLVGMPRDQVEQHLDDVLGVGLPGEEGVVHDFYRAYREEAGKCGIKIDSSGSRDKCQAPDTTFIGLGVCFDTVRWVWWLKEDKLLTILHALLSIQRSTTTSLKELQSVTGKLVDIRDLVPGGRYNLLYFHCQVAEAVKGDKQLANITEGLKAQAMWWFLSLQANQVHSPIIHPDERMTSTAVYAYSDAAGGSRDSIKAGVGAVMLPGRWVYVPWPAWLNAGGRNRDGVRFSSKLSCLELLGPLLVVATMGMECKGRVLVVMVDNAGSVAIYRKGHSVACPYSSTVAKAAFDLSERWGVRLIVKKIRRCSNKGAVIADAISKGDFPLVRQMMKDREKAPRVVPSVLWDWVSRPRVDLSLGDKIAQELGLP